MSHLNFCQQCAIEKCRLINVADTSRIQNTFWWTAQSFCKSLRQSVINGKKPRLMVRLFEHPWASALGTFSYSLYLIDEPVLVLVRYFLFSL